MAALNHTNPRKRKGAHLEEIVDVTDGETSDTEDASIVLLDTPEKPPVKCRKTGSPSPNLNESNSGNVSNVSDDPCDRGKEEDYKMSEGELEEEEDGAEVVLQPVKPKPVITVTFSDVKMGEKYRAKFVAFINKFTELSSETCKLKILVKLKEDEENLEKVKKRKNKSKAKKELFIVDPTPGVQNVLKTPAYSSKYKLMPDGETANDESAGLSMNACFNCEGNHNLRDCPLPKDFNKIRMARAKKPAKVARYHLEEEQKFAHLIPGRLSDKLRQALGLREYDTPAHVYKMRVSGYPPGWLEEARRVRSNLTVYDIEGEKVTDKPADVGKPNHIDPEKVIEYPGFNVPLDKGYYDDYKYHGVPPFSTNFKKENMIKYFEDLQTKTKENCDMDVILDKALPIESESSQEEKSRDSPSLIDLESQKKQLLEALVIDDSSDANENAKETKNVSDACNDDLNSLNVTNNSDVVVIDDSEETLHPDDGEDCLTPGNNVRSSVFGTPILKSASPYDRLPNSVNFSKDVSPMINFENLPNSTGKYEQMTGLLDKVRKTMRNLQENT